MSEPYERPEFQNAVEYTVSITYRVAGGAQHGTADRRAERVAERLANAAARAKHVVEVSALAGESRKGEMQRWAPVAFDTANSDPSRLPGTDKLTRYVDPEHDRARLLLHEHNRSVHERQEADRRRRAAVGCRARYRARFEPRPQWCPCAYCAPVEHLAAVRDDLRDDGTDGERLCVCGESIRAGRRCTHHLDVRLVVLHGDEAALTLLAHEEEATT